MIVFLIYGHQIRHTFCTRLCEHKTNIKEIQPVMGHADLQTTMIKYTEVTLSRNMETLDLFSYEMSFFWEIHEIEKILILL